MTIAIKEGGFYLTRAGRHVGPARRANEDEAMSFGECFPWKVGPYTYRDNGQVGWGDDVVDIVAEWVDEPAMPTTGSGVKPAPDSKPGAVESQWDKYTEAELIDRAARYDLYTLAALGSMAAPHCESVARVAAEWAAGHTDAMSQSAASGSRFKPGDRVYMPSLLGNPKDAGRFVRQVGGMAFIDWTRRNGEVKRSAYPIRFVEPVPVEEASDAPMLFLCVVGVLALLALCAALARMA